MMRKYAHDYAAPLTHMAANILVELIPTNVVVKASAKRLL